MYEMTEKKADELKKALDLVKYAIGDVENVLSNVKRIDEPKVKMSLVILRDFFDNDPEIVRFEIPLNSIKDKGILKIYNNNTAEFDHYVFSSSNGYSFIYVKSDVLEISNGQIRKGIYHVEN